jgi:hypothetical protein
MYYSQILCSIYSKIKETKKPWLVSPESGSTLRLIIM